jgi:LDH2 family malate/lactate/ureidoglycolate dehydrogenase
MIALRNAAHDGRLALFGERIAQSGAIGVVTNVGGAFPRR